MALFLTIDQGNTAAKLALWRDHTLAEMHITEHLTADVIAQFLGVGVKADAAIYCSVASRGTPGSLGADRIAAAAGAWSPGCRNHLLVVDAGTAVTYDAVTPDGQFIGGNIAPGMNMRLEALHRFTARLPRVQVPRELPEGSFLGHDTTSAMILGAVYGIVGSISYYKNHLPSDTRVVMTGGWAGELSRLCDFDVTVDPHLVSKGLNRILIYNENI